MKEEEDTSSRVERSLKEGYWNFPLEPTSTEICAALRAREFTHYEDGYPENLVSLNRFFVMHKVGYRNGKGVKLEGWKTYDDHLMTKTSSGPLNGNDDLVLRIFALRPVIKGVEPIKLCWVKQLSKGHQSGRRKKYQYEDENNPIKKLRTASSSSPSFGQTPSSPSPPPQLDTSTQSLAPQAQSHTQSNPDSPSVSLLRPDSTSSPTRKPDITQLSPLSPLTKYNTVPLPGLHVTLAGLFNRPPVHLPPLDPESTPPKLKSEPSSPPRHNSSYKTSPTISNTSYLKPSERQFLSPPLPPDTNSNTRYMEPVGRNASGPTPTRKNVSDRDAPFSPVSGSSWNR